ncbi:MAG: nicotinate (nicotinamide) nucleotide adenylyltransferase [Trueperaceae bacterium]
MRVGLFGGRFDPPHLGHLLLAEQAREAAGLDRVAFVPAADPPHKAAHATAQRRLAMTRLATEDHPAFEVDDRELRRDGPSFTLDTVTSFRRERSGDEATLLIGADAWAEIESWHRAAELARTVRVLVLPRPGTDVATLRRLPEPFRSAATLLDAIPFGVSSSEVRRRLAVGASLRYLVPEPVIRYLEEQRPYSTPAPEEDEDRP